MLNLSCQMTNMAILSDTDRMPSRNAKKRVRFSVPEQEDNTTIVPDTRTEYRRREAGEFLKAKRRLPKPCLCKISEIEDGIKLVDLDGYEADKEMVDEEEAKCVKRRKRENIGNVNWNCATRGKASAKGEMVRANNSNRGKSKSEVCLPKHQDRKGKKRVVSKKASVKDDTWCNRYVIGDKRKVSDILKEFRAYNTKEAKKRKLFLGDSEKNKMLSKSCTVKQSSSKSLSKSKMKVKSYRSKMASAKVKKANEKLKKAKEANKKRLLKQANENRKKALKRKQQLKRKLAQRRKATKKQSTGPKRKLVRKTNPRKVRIIPIEREDDVGDDLRVNLLKFITFSTAYDRKYDCCRRYCWDRWEELDIDDVIADFD